MAKLSTKDRKALPKGSFVFPKEKRYPIHDLSHAKNALARSSGKPEESTVRAAVYRKYPQLKKFETVVPFIKDEAQQLVYGVVLTPDWVDSQGDAVAAHVIEKAAHNWMKEYQTSDVQHEGIVADVTPVESFIAPADFELDGQPVQKGSWIVVSHVEDPEVWDRVQKGELTGYSIGGSGERIEVDDGDYEE